MATTSIHRRTPGSTTERPQQGDPKTSVARPGTGRPESALRATARRQGLTMQELAARMRVTPGHLSALATGRKSWTPAMRERAAAVLGDVPSEGFVYRQGGVVTGESSYIRERARELGMSMRELAERVGVSHGYMVRVSRGHRSMGVKVRARVESALRAPARVAPEQCAGIDRQAVWDRMNAHGVSQNEVARRAGVSSAHLSRIMAGRRSPSPEVVKRLHGVLFRRTEAEWVMPAEMKVLGWKKGKQRGMVVQGAGGPGRGARGGTVRVGGRVPEGAKVEYAFRTGYDGRGRVSVTHLIERGCSAMLTRPDMHTS